MSGNGHGKFMMRSDDRSDKKSQVEGMFDAIAPTYDALNHLLSLGIDQGWRKRVVKMVAAGFREKRTSAASSQALHTRIFDENENIEPSRHIDLARNNLPSAFRLLDVATGTGDLAMALAKRMPEAQVTGVDISERMLAVGREKVLRAGLGERIALQRGDAEALEFDAGVLDCVTVAFGVRNFGDIPGGLREMCRVLRPGGRCFVLEFSEPTVPVFAWVYRFYFHCVLPWLGRLVSRDRAAYSYLPRSVDAFPAPERFSEMLGEAGFSSVRMRRLTGGVAWVYEAEK